MHNWKCKTNYISCKNTTFYQFMWLILKINVLPTLACRMKHTNNQLKSCYSQRDSCCTKAHLISFYGSVLPIQTKMLSFSCSCNSVISFMLCLCYAEWCGFWWLVMWLCVKKSCVCLFDYSGQPYKRSALFNHNKDTVKSFSLCGRLFLSSGNFAFTTSRHQRTWAVLGDLWLTVIFECLSTANHCYKTKQ